MEGGDLYFLHPNCLYFQASSPSSKGLVNVQARDLGRYMTSFSIGFDVIIAVIFCFVLHTSV